MTDKQRGVVRGMVTAVVLIALSMGLAIIVQPAWLLPLTDTPAARLGWAAVWLLPPAMFLLVSIGRLAGYRFHSPEDMDGSGLTDGSDGAHIRQAVIQNSLEQTVLAALVWTAYAMLLPHGWLAALPVASALFVCGRLLFGLGYSGGAPARALGFALTFYSTVVLALAAALAGVAAILGF